MKQLNLALWALQIVIALAFAVAGFDKMSTPIDLIIATLPWLATASEGLIRALGIAQFFGALLLILPSATRLRPQLSIAAAVFLGLLTVALTVWQLLHHDSSALPFNFVFTVSCGLIAWGRERVAPIAAR